MPLHLSLGLRKQALELVEIKRLCPLTILSKSKMDRHARNWQELERRESAQEECYEIERELDALKEAATCAEEKLQDFLSESKSYLKKEGRRYVLQKHVQCMKFH